MSRIGSKIIVVPESVTLEILTDSVKVKGPKGELSVQFPSNILKASQENNEFTLSVLNDDKSTSAFQGLYRMLIFNAVVGVTEGFKKELELSGVGYRVQKSGSDLNFSLGYSHPVVFKTVDGIDFAVEGTNKVIITGIDKQLVGQVTANIVSLRDAKKDPYKNKGINIVGRKLLKKAGKVK